MSRIVGKEKAMEIVLMGDPIDAKEAYRIGLIGHVVPQRDLINMCEKIAYKIIKNTAASVRLSMEAINKGLEMPLQQGLELEAALIGFVCCLEETKERIKTYSLKRRVGDR